MSYCIGIDIGGTQCAVVKGNGEGISEKIRFDTEDAKTTLEKIFSATESLMPAVAIRVPERETYKVQELHLTVYHAICAELERRLFG